MKITEKSFKFRYDWGNGSFSPWTPLEVEEIRDERSGFLADPTPEAIANLIERLEKLPIGGFAECYHGGGYKVLEDGTKSYCTEMVEFRRIA